VRVGLTYDLRDDYRALGFADEELAEADQVRVVDVLELAKLVCALGIGLLVSAAADQLRDDRAIPFAAYCTDPCDGRTQGTTGMFDSLPYRNDAALGSPRVSAALSSGCCRARWSASCPRAIG
jgi:dihydroxyacid dehydratase/phosphogluconate dehydratase